MKKHKTLWIVSSFVVIIILLSVGWYINYKLKMHNLEESLRNYLINEKGIKSTEILSIHARRSKMPMYPVTVRFKNDPEEYVYTDKEGTEWFQVYPDPN
ncbi:DUF3139 domain-containing protein [Paenibacillus amylolyticus]|uniref:DUF3139 domain-containing protein n=1 Tax=Paenibacillus xylanexedens TaxID=528191 RepID=UPI000938471E|nr:DUF3139 domain-containing protein [Paenibacillus xylanexedens]APO43358.1 hypothetical protein BS614_04355 [Paenibacillus xylanexedens]WKL02420.1 DUF3139 domain-containing protein [Paenibacillus amylolyticus]